MKIYSLLVLIICSSQIFNAQTLKIYKNDQTTLDFQLSDIDSITFTTSSSAKITTSSDWLCITSRPGNSIGALIPASLEEVEEGLQILGVGNDNTTYFIPSAQNSITSKTIYLKWKVIGSVVNLGVDLLPDVQNLNLSERIINLVQNQ